MKLNVDHMVQNPPFPRNYASSMLVIDRGEGCRLFDEAGNAYLDFGAGIAVNALGYGRSDIADVMAAQARRLAHTSNLYAHRPGLELAQRLLQSFGNGSQMSAVHFGNSGAEANEAALKYARLYAHERRGPGHHKIMSFTGAFHGRTMGALAATPKPKYKSRFEPLVPGVETAPFNDVGALECMLSPEFSAVIVEVVQGEGGLAVMSEEFASALNRLCKRHDVLLIADEVQTGLGRTGRLYASDLVGLEPDIVTLAKPLAAGLPLSATLIPEKVNELLHVGDHGTTFGGGPVTTAVALHVFAILTDPEFLVDVARKATYLRSRLSELADDAGADDPDGPKGADRVLGAGLLAGLSVGRADDAEGVGGVIARCQELGLLVLRSGVNALRLAPPLVVTEEEIDEAIETVKRSLNERSAS